MSTHIHCGFVGEPARQLAMELKNIFAAISDIKVFVDESDNRYSEDWYNSIFKSVKECNCGIYLVTADAINRPDWLIAESMPIICSKKPAHFLYFEPVSPSDFPDPLKRFGAVPFRRANRKTDHPMIDLVSRLTKKNAAVVAEYRHSYHKEFCKKVTTTLKQGQHERPVDGTDGSKLIQIERQIDLLHEKVVGELKQIGDIIGHANGQSSQNVIEEVTKNLKELQEYLVNEKHAIDDAKAFTDKHKKKVTELAPFMLSLNEWFKDFCRVTRLPDKYQSKRMPVAGVGCRTKKSKKPDGRLFFWP